MNDLSGSWNEFGTTFARDSDGRLYCGDHDIHPINYAKYVVCVDENRKKEVLYDPSDCIMDLHKRAAGNFAESRLDFFCEYFFVDFSFAARGAQECLRDSDRFWRRLLNRTSRGDHLGYAYVLGRRARQSVERARSISSVQRFPEEWDYELSLINLDRFEKRLGFATEYPKNYAQIFALTEERDDAIDVEDYDAVSDIRDEIERLERQNA